MRKPLCLIQSPVATRSGYGDMSRDIISHIMDLDEYEVKLVSMPWGSTPMNALDAEDPLHYRIMEAIIHPQNGLDRQPDLFIQISVPNEYRPIGKYNIGITAGIETTLCSAPWIEGCNRMDLICTISEHSKNSLQNSKVEMKHKNTGQLIKTIRIDTPIEVLHNCVHTDVFKSIQPSKISDEVNDIMDQIEEDFNYLFVGHWLSGGIGEDRKNVGLLIKTFCETFKDSEDMPGLILKTSGAGFSIIDRENILDKIENVRGKIGGNLPNIYLIHGDLTVDQMNELYNHPKVKAHVSFTKGEGFGRPLLEATMSLKPIIASGWSGHMDFLNKDDAVLLGGELRNVEPGAVWENVIMREASWFNVDVDFASKALKYVKNNYTEVQSKCKRLSRKNRKEFSYEAIKKRTKEILDQYVPEFEAQPEEIELKLPSLKKLG